MVLEPKILTQFSFDVVNLVPHLYQSLSLLSTAKPTNDDVVSVSLYSFVCQRPPTIRLFIEDVISKLVTSVFIRFCFRRRLYIRRRLALDPVCPFAPEIPILSLYSSLHRRPLNLSICLLESLYLFSTVVISPTSQI